MKIYLAGPLFTRAEQEERNSQTKQIRDCGFEVYNPLEHNEPDGERNEDTSKVIFEKDINAMKWADCAIVNLDNFDSGTMVELGWFYAMKKPIYAIWTDFRGKPNNLFVLGCCNWYFYPNLRKILSELALAEELR